MEALATDGPAQCTVPSGSTDPLVASQRQAVVGEHWDLPVEQAHAAFDRALAGFADTSGRAATGTTSGRQAPAGHG